MVIFSKWLTHGFSPKMTIFPKFFFRQYNPGKCLLRYSRRKKRLSRLLKDEVKKVEKWPFFQRGLTHGFDPKMTIFPTFFLGNIAVENIFYDILEREKRHSRL